MLSEKEDRNAWRRVFELICETLDCTWAEYMLRKELQREHERLRENHSAKTLTRIAEINCKLDECDRDRERKKERSR